MSLNHVETQKHFYEMLYEVLGDQTQKTVLQKMLASFLFNNTCANWGIKHPFPKLIHNTYILYLWPEAQ